MIGGRQRGALALVLGAALAAFVASAGANHSVYSQVSAGARKGNGPFDFTFRAASTDGGRVFFESDEQLTNDDTDATTDVYERSNGITTLVSKGQINGNGAFPAGFRGASSDGSRVFFASNEKLTSDDTDAVSDVFERAGGVTKRVSRGAIGGNGPYPVFYAGALADGSAVFFQSDEKLTTDDADGATDVFQRAGGVTTRVSKGAINGNGDVGAQFRGVSADGTRIFFESAEKLVSDDMDDWGDVYKRAGGTTILVSDGEINGDGAQPATFVGASGDGTHVFFKSPEQLATNDFDMGLWDIYERSGGSTTLVSEQTNQDFDPMFAGCSTDGSHVFFETTDKVGFDDGDSFKDVYERFSGVVWRVSQGDPGKDTFGDSFFRGASADGTRVYFETIDPLTSDDMNGRFDVYERAFGAMTTRISKGPVEVQSSVGAGSFFRGASPNGSRVFFVSDAQFSQDDGDSKYDVYERSANTTTLISRGQINGNGDFDADAFKATADGSKVFFQTAEQLTSDDDDGSRDLYQRSGGTTTRLSGGDLKGNGPFAAALAGSSANGGRLFFTSAEQLTSDDVDLVPDLYQRSGATTTRLSAGQTNGQDPYSASFAGASTDGTKVFFTTVEALTGDDGDASVDLYERDGTTTTRVSQGEINGNQPYDVSFVGASADGSRVFFQSAEQLSFDEADIAVDVYQRYGGMTTRLSQGPTGGNGSAFDATFRGASADGSKVFFTSAEKLTGDDADSVEDLYQRSAGVTTRLSQGPIGGNGASKAGFAGASADGGRVFFQTAEKLTSDDTDSVVDLYERAGGVTTKVSKGNGAFPVTFAGTSTDGTHVFFTTAEKLVSVDTDAKIDVYERSGGVTSRVSQGNGAFDATFRGASTGGGKIFFTTAEKLTADDSDAAVDLYQRAAGVTTRISRGAVNGNGTFSVVFSRASADGSRVFFTTDEKLTSDDTDATADVYERYSGVTTRISKGQINGNGAFPAAFGVASADGSKVFFTTIEKLASTDTDAVTDIYSAAVP